MVGNDGKLYFRLVDVSALLGRSKYTNLPTIRPPGHSGTMLPIAHKPYPHHDARKSKNSLPTSSLTF
ncbi:hypothetical protein TNCV_1382321 [Trichonephila clavipes]|nr:hypothetical protein TNCV_1382321 [Trichonephila clavipes]